jgi:hypothetical protein
MTSTHRRRLSWRAGIGTSALALLPALVMTAGTAGASAPNVVQVRTSAPVTLPDAGATLMTVESVKLATGSWTVTSNATAVNFGAGDFVRCQLDAHGTLIDGGATTYLANRVGGLVETATLKANAPTTVALRCDHDHAATTANQFYFDPGVTLTAVRGGPIESPNVHTSASPVVVESRTTAQVPLTNTRRSPVTSVKLPNGRWAVTANATGVDFTEFDFFYCTLTVSSGGTITSSTPLVGIGSSDAIVSGLTVEATAVVPAAGGTVRLVCATDYGSNAYLDPGATLTATLVPQASNLMTHPLSSVDLPDAAGVAGNVISKKMPAGAWRIQTAVVAGLRAPNNGYVPGSDFVRCSLWAGNTRLDGGATILGHGGYIEAIVNAGTYTAAAQWTLRLSCSHDFAATDGNHWTLLDGMAQGIRKGPIASPS